MRRPSSRLPPSPSCWVPAPSRPRLARRPPRPRPQGVRGSPITASGKTRIALLLPLSGRAAPIGQAMQQAAEMALFDTGAKELALAAYDSGDSADTATEAYRKARTDGVALVLGPLFGTSATALAPLVTQGGANVISFSNDEVGRPARRLDHGHRRPAAGPPRRRPRRRRRHQALRRLRAADDLRRADGAHAGKPGRRARRHRGRVELYDPDSADLATAAQAARRRGQGRGQARRAGAGGAAPAVDGAGLAGRGRHRQQVGAVHRHRRLGRARHRLGSHAARRLVCRPRSGAARRLRAQVRRDLRPAAAAPGDARLRRRGAGRPSRAAEAGRRFLGRGDHQSQRLVRRRRRLPLPARRPHRSARWR